MRIATGEANLLLGCDLVVSVSDDAIAKLRRGFSRSVVSSDMTITGEFVRSPDVTFPLAAMEQELVDALGRSAAEFVPAARLARALTANPMATNVFLLGYAWQRGLVPVSAAGIERAIELNGTAVEDNLRAFAWGRRAAHDLTGTEALARARETSTSAPLSERLDEIVARRRAFLADYQDMPYGERYAARVECLRVREAALRPGSTALTEAVARNYFRLLAYKDEYEVARLHLAPEFLRAIDAAFEGDYRVRYHLTVPGMRGEGGAEPKKHAFGPWIRPAFRLLSAARRLRGTRFDPFGYSADRRLERRLIREYETLLDELLAGLDQHNFDSALALAQLPEKVRGYGPVKARAAAQWDARRCELGVLSQNRRNFRHPSSSPATSASRSIILPSLWKV